MAIVLHQAGGASVGPPLISFDPPRKQTKGATLKDEKGELVSLINMYTLRLLAPNSLFCLLGSVEMEYALSELRYTNLIFIAPKLVSLNFGPKTEVPQTEFQ